MYSLIFIHGELYFAIVKVARLLQVHLVSRTVNCQKRLIECRKSCTSTDKSAQNLFPTKDGQEKF